MNDISGQFILDGRTNSSGGGDSQGPNFDPVKMARQLARAVALGLLSENQANTRLLLASSRAAREGKIACDPVAHARLLVGIMRRCKHRFNDLRENAGGAVRGAVAPLIALRVPPRRLFAEAGNANGDHGFLLTEEEVNEIVGRQVVSFLNPEEGASE